MRGLSVIQKIAPLLETRLFVDVGRVIFGRFTVASWRELATVEIHLPFPLDTFLKYAVFSAAITIFNNSCEPPCDLNISQ